jgi:hypothetical protein
MTPGSSSNGGSMHQKQPPANVAFSCRASVGCPLPIRGWARKGDAANSPDVISASRMMRLMSVLDFTF